MLTVLGFLSVSLKSLPSLIITLTSLSLSGVRASCDIASSSVKTTLYEDRTHVDDRFSPTIRPVSSYHIVCA